jgi:cytidylate kinase
MKIDLAAYMKQRFEERNTESKSPGPVVTIAREAGCPGKKIAQLLTEGLNDRLRIAGEPEKWKWIGKEIFIEAAKELDLEPAIIEDVFKHKRNIVDQIISAQASKFYKNDRVVRKTIGEVIRSIANDGHSIVLGRGGVVIAHDIPKSLHVYLEAPLEWRSSIISEKENYTLEEARKYAIETDRQRAQYRDYYHGKHTDYTWYDVKFNCMTLSVTEIVEDIIKLMELKNLI